MEDVSDMRGNC